MQHGVLLIIAAASALASAASAAATLPPAWIENVARGRYMSTAATVADGLFPAVGNGYIAGDAGCSNVSADPSVKGGSCGRIHVAGVFSNGTYMDYNGTFPMRAAARRLDGRELEPLLEVEAAPEHQVRVRREGGLLVALQAQLRRALQVGIGHQVAVCLSLWRQRARALIFFEFKKQNCR